MRQVTLIELSLKLRRILVSYEIRSCSRIFQQKEIQKITTVNRTVNCVFKESRWAGLEGKPEKQQVSLTCVWLHTGWRPEQWAAGTGCCCQEEWAWEGSSMVLWWTTTHSWTRQPWSQCSSHQEVLSKCRYLGTLSQCWDVEIPDMRHRKGAPLQKTNIWAGKPVWKQEI